MSTNLGESVLLLGLLFAFFSLLIIFIEVYMKRKHDKDREYNFMRDTHEVLGVKSKRKDK